jgi:hypothetical protein
MRISTILAAIAIGLPAAAGLAAEKSRCLDMLSGAPEAVRSLEAVQTCRGAGAGCGYLEPAPGHGVLTLICPRSGVRQILYADRLSALALRDGALVGGCRHGSWQRDATLPGCYADREEPREP